jgi:hypothetical protein
MLTEIADGLNRIARYSPEIDVINATDTPRKSDEETFIGRMQSQLSYMEQNNHKLEYIRKHITNLI